MPDYEVRAPDGHTLVIHGDTPPTEADLDDIFKTVAPAPSSWVTQHPVAADIARKTLDTLPAVGAMAGGILATPETAGAGTAIGIGLGAAGGRGVRDLIAEQLGLQEPSTMQSEGARMGLDFAVSAGTQAALPGLVEAAQTPIQTAKEFVGANARSISRLLPSIIRPHAVDAIAEWAARMKATGPVLSQPAWQTWTVPAADKLHLNALDVIRIKSFMKQGLSEAEAIDTAVKLKGASGNPSAMSQFLTAHR